MEDAVMIMATQASSWNNFAGQTITPKTAELVQFSNQNYITVEHSIDWMEKAQQRLNHLCSLRNGWDGYRGRPTRIDVGYFAIQLLQMIASCATPEPSIVPLSSGGLQIEWHLEHIEIEITIRAPSDVTVWMYESNGDEDGMELPHLTNDFTNLMPYIKKLG